MAKKENRVSVNAFEKYVKENYRDEPIQVEVDGLSFFVKPCLSMNDVVTFTKIVSESVFDNNGTYYPEMKEFLIRRSILEMYAGFAMPKNIEKQYELVVRAEPLVREVVQHADKRQFDALLGAIDEKIDAIIAVNESTVKRQVNELYSMISNLGSQLEGMFDGVDAGGLAKLVEAIGEGGIDQEKIVKAYFDYKSDDETQSDGDE
jgi:hypothetical protein